MFVSFMLGPLFGWLIFSSKAGTDRATLNCWNKDPSSPANFKIICSSSNECKYSFSFELHHEGPILVAGGCHNKHNYNCEKGTFNFRLGAIMRRTQAPHGLLFTYASYKNRQSRTTCSYFCNRKIKNRNGLACNPDKTEEDHLCSDRKSVV